MAHHVSIFEALGSRSSSHLGLDPITAKAYVATLPKTGTIVFGGEDDQRDGQINVPCYGLNLVSARHVFGRVVTDEPDYAIVEAHAESTYWSIDGSHYANGAATAIQRNPVAPNPRIGGPLQFEFSGDAQTQIETLTGTITSLDCRIELAPPLEQCSFAGLLDFGEFEQIPEGSTSESVRVRELLELFASPSARYSLGVDQNGTALYAENCNFAAYGSDAIVYCAPEDRGNGAGQIPASVADNTAAAFRAHPSVFFRRTDYLRHVARRAVDLGAINLTLAEQPIKIGEIGGALVDSDWLIVVDGVAHLVRLTHPDGSDLRRPRDIWNQVWVPIIAGSQATSLATAFESLGTQTVGQVGTRLGYLQYARMVGLGSSPPEVTYTPQQDTGQEV